MNALRLFSLSLLLLQGSIATSVPSRTLGKWKIGKPFSDMATQPIGLSARQENMLIGQTLEIHSTSITACGIRIHIDSVQAVKYSAEAFLQRYGIRPDQIGLNSPLISYSLGHSRSKQFCGNSEGLDIITDGQNATLEDGNDYFHLSRVKSEPQP